MSKGWGAFRVAPAPTNVQGTDRGIIRSSASACSMEPAGRTSVPSSASRSSSGGWQQRRGAQRAALEAEAKRKEQLFQDAMQRKRAAEAAQREAAFQQLYSEVVGGLELGSSGNSILGEVAEMEAAAAAAHAARRRELHQQWHSAVFEPMQRRLQAALAARSTADVAAALQAASRAHITATKTQPLHRDELTAADHDALAPLGRAVKIPTADLQDPLLHDLLKAQAEQALLAASHAASGCTAPISSSSSSSSRRQRAGGRGVRRSGRCGSPAAAQQLQQQQVQQQQVQLRHGLAAAVTRPMLDTTRWAAGKINATPYGHCVDERTAEYIVRPAAPAALAQKKSTIHFDDFST